MKFKKWVSIILIVSLMVMNFSYESVTGTELDLIGGGGTEVETTVLSENEDETKDVTESVTEELESTDEEPAKIGEETENATKEAESTTKETASVTTS